MIKEFEFFHGAVLSRLIQNAKGIVNIKTFNPESNSSYIINEEIGLYIKYSKKRLPPWHFTFIKEHQDEILKMKESLKNVFVCFVCNADGIALIGFDELKEILDHNHKESEWVAISRRKNEMYSLSGSDGKLSIKIGENNFPSKLFE